MSELQQLQTAFTRALLQGDDTVAGMILGDGLQPEARLALYRHHVFTTLTDVLQAAYPVVCRLVDERFFAYAAAHYIRQEPPSGPCLFEYGASFPDFLATFPPCQGLAYLPDVARLEWAVQAAWYAEQTVPLELTCLQGFAPEELEALQFSFDPAVAYLASPWPVDRIWRVNQSEAAADEIVPLDAGATYLEVGRHNDDSVVQALPPATWSFRAALATGQRLADALEAALAIIPDFDLSLALQELFAARLIIDVRVFQTEEMA
jgi:hypothetical protein